MKKIIIPLCVFYFLSAVASPRFVDVQEEKPANPDLSVYQSIYISELDIPVSLWKKFEYESKAEWQKVINDINMKRLKMYMSENLPKKTIVAPVKSFTGKRGAFIKIKYAGFRENTGRAFGHRVNSMDIVVTIYDNRSKKKLYSAKLATQTAGMGKRGWMMNSFEGRLDNQIYNLCGFMASKF